MILSPGESIRVKAAVDELHPCWRQVGMVKGQDVLGPEEPPILIVRIGTVDHAIAAGASIRVFRSGHLGADHMWGKNGCGCAVKSEDGIRMLERIGEPAIPGFIHLHRFGMWTGRGTTGPEPEARAFFGEHSDEFSAFFPVTFMKDDDPIYPWRAVRRDLP